MKRMTFLLTVLLWSMVGYAHAEDYGGPTGTVQHALENNRTNQSSTWVNPDNDSSGTVAPTRTFQNAQGQPCREFRQIIVIGGREEQGYGTACRQPDGTWLIVSDQPDASTAAPVEQRVTVYEREVVRPYPYDYYPYGYYAPWGYAYPYWSPYSFSFSLGYQHRDGGHRHGGYYGDRHRHGGHDGGGHRRGGHRRR